MELTPRQVNKYPLSVYKNKIESASHVLARYPKNSPTPANLHIVTGEQAYINRAIENRLVTTMPDHYSPSVRNMILTAQRTTLATLSLENQLSYEQVRQKESSSIVHAIWRDKYERGLATPEEVLETYFDLGMESAELLKRTELAEDYPDDLMDALLSLYEDIEAQQGPYDTFGAQNSRARVKQFDKGAGKGGTEAMVVSYKDDIATMENGASTVTQRTKLIIDFTKLPMKRRALLRHKIAHFQHDSDKADDWESVLDIENPENPGETLRGATVRSPYTYHFATTVYVSRISDETQQSLTLVDESD